MSQNEISASKQDRLDQLKSRLDTFMGRASITKFEGQDIIELVEEGESIDWIADQLKRDRPEISVDEIAALLTDIQTLVGPERKPEPEKPTGEPAAEVEEETAAEPMRETGIPVTSQADLSQLDLSQLGAMLPPGMKLPSGLKAEQIQDMMQSPQGKVMSDFLLFCREKGVDLNVENLNQPQVRELQNEWQSTPREAFEGKRPSEVMQESPLFGKVETYRREEPRVGRNDPCPCGSGKKYKKCCGRK